MTKSAFNPTVVDQATINHYVAKAQRERSRTVVALLRSLFAKSAPAAGSRRTNRTTAAA